MTDLTLANGNVRLAASIDGPMDAVPILLLHGASVSRDTWDETKQQLMDRYCVWTSIFVVTSTLIARRITTSQVMSDAKAALAAIGRPAIVVGHSLWACVVGVLTKSIRTSVRCFSRTRRGSEGVPTEWNRSVFSKVFLILPLRPTKWQQESPPFATTARQSISSADDRRSILTMLTRWR